MALANMYKDLENENKKLREELLSKNEYINELEDEIVYKTLFDIRENR
jgi:hypothetical protein